VEVKLVPRGERPYLPPRLESCPSVDASWPHVNVSTDVRAELTTTGDAGGVASATYGAAVQVQFVMFTSAYAAKRAGWARKAWSDAANGGATGQDDKCAVVWPRQPIAIVATTTHPDTPRPNRTALNEHQLGAKIGKPRTEWSSLSRGHADLLCIYPIELCRELPPGNPETGSNGLARAPAPGHQRRRRQTNARLRETNDKGQSSWSNIAAALAPTLLFR
jgi:hypothetical protein